MGFIVWVNEAVTFIERASVVWAVVTARPWCTKLVLEDTSVI